MLYLSMGIISNIPVQTDADKMALFLVIEEQKNYIEKLTETIARQEHLIKLLQKALFGQKSEKIIDTDERQGVFEDILNEVDQLNPPVESEAKPEVGTESQEAKRPPKKAKKRRSLRELVDSNLPREEIVIDLPEEQLVIGENTRLKCIGEDRVEKLAYQPGHWFIKVFVYPKYADPGNALAGVKRAPAPDFAVPGGIFDESVYAWMFYAKYVLHLPYYRLAEEFMASTGVELSRQTMSASGIKIARVLSPLVDLMKQELISRGIAFTDETPVKMLQPGSGKTKKAFIWVYVCGGQGPPYRIYEFAQKRDHRQPTTFLKNFKGYVHADAFGGYNALFADDNIIECGCWMHVRRKFFEAEDVEPELRRQVLRLIRNIYRYERVLKKYDREKQADFILKIRREKIGPIIDALFTLTAKALTDGRVMLKSNFANAISYMHNLGNALKSFLDNPYLQPDNGTSERALRPITIGRDNWMFLGSEKGGEAMGILMSLVQTCRVMNINVLEYLEDVLRRINGHPASKLHELLPGNWKKLDSYYNCPPLPNFPTDMYQQRRLLIDNVCR